MTKGRKEQCSDKGDEERSVGGVRVISRKTKSQCIVYVFI